VLIELGQILGKFKLVASAFTNPVHHGKHLADSRVKPIRRVFVKRRKHHHGWYVNVSQILFQTQLARFVGKSNTHVKKGRQRYLGVIFEQIQAANNNAMVL